MVYYYFVTSSAMARGKLLTCQVQQRGYNEGSKEKGQSNRAVNHEAFLGLGLRNLIYEISNLIV